MSNKNIIKDAVAPRSNHPALRAPLQRRGMADAEHLINIRPLMKMNAIPSMAMRHAQFPSRGGVAKGRGGLRRMVRCLRSLSNALKHLKQRT